MVGAPTFLGPGRVCCRRQPKIRPGPEAPEACWAWALVRSTYHTPYLSEEFFCRCPSEVPSEGGRAKSGFFWHRGRVEKMFFFRGVPLFSHPFFASIFGWIFGVHRRAGVLQGIPFGSLYFGSFL